MATRLAAVTRFQLPLLGAESIMKIGALVIQEKKIGFSMYVDKSIQPNASS